MNQQLLLQHFDRISDAPDALPRLRRFVLDLAVRGKLVEQDPSDEMKPCLFETIKAEKLRLVKTGVTKGNKPRAVVKDAEICFDVPSSWLWVRLSDITSYIQRGKSPKYAITGDGLPVISQRCVQWSGLDLESAKLITTESVDSYEANRFLRDGDLLWNSTGTGTIGRVIRVSNPPPRLVCDSHVTVVRCLLADSEYVRLWLSSDHVYGSIEDRAAGSTNQVELTSQMANDQVVPLPPLAEQRRIVAKVDELMALCNRLEAAQNEREARRDRLATASLHRLNNGTEADELRESAQFYINHLALLTTHPGQVRQLRQSIFHLAIRGVLVCQDPKDESATYVLERIREQMTLAKQGGKGKRAVSLPAIDITAVPFELPQGWAWARFPELGVFGRGKSKHRPRNDRSLFEGGNHLLVQTGDVARSNGVIRTHTSKYNDAGLAQSAKWPTGTLCITIAANIAASGLLSFDACFPDSVVGFIPNSEFPDAKYFEYFVRTAKANLSEFAPATAQKNINLEILNAVLIPIPPPGEQLRIVSKIDELMALCDHLEKQLATTQNGSRRLLDAVLYQALSPVSMEAAS